MKSYQLLSEISIELLNSLRTGKDVKKVLETNVNRIHAQISDDFKMLFERELKLVDFQTYFDDPSYRQSATVLVLNEKIVNHDNFEIRVECLIDHGRIWIKVSHEIDNPGFIEISKRIAKAQGNEGLSEFRDIE